MIGHLRQGKVFDRNEATNTSTVLSIIVAPEADIGGGDNDGAEEDEGAECE